MTVGNKLDEILEDNQLLLYLAIGFVCFSVLFLFTVILMISVVTIRMQKIKEAQGDLPGSRGSETVIANPQNLSHSGRSFNEPTKRDRHRPDLAKNGTRPKNGPTRVDYLDYMDLIIMDATNMNLPRAKKVDTGEKTI